GHLHKAVILRLIMLSAHESEFVARRLGYAGTEIVAHHRLRYAADRRKGIDVGGDPIGKPLRPARFRVGVVRRPERGDEDVSGTFRIRYLIEHRHCVAGVIDEQPRSGRVRLTHRRRDGLAPFAIEIAETTVTVAVRLL